MKQGERNMNPLQSRLASLRRRFRSVTLIRGLSLAVIIFVGCGLTAGLLDWKLHLPAVVRAVLLVLTVGGTLVGLYWYLFAPLSSKTDDLALALQIENEYPILNDALASTVEFMQKPEDSPSAGSAALRKEAVGRALRMAQGCDFNRVVNTRGLRTSSLIALSVMTVAGLLVFWYPSVVRSAVLRLAHPFGEHDWPTQTQLRLDYPKRVATGHRFEIKGTVTGVIPKKAFVSLLGYSQGDESPREYRIKKLEDGTGAFSAKLDLSDQRSDFKFVVVANDARAPRRKGAWHTVEVDEPPRLIPVDGVPPPQQLRVDIPAYTELPTPEFLAPGTKHIEAIEGSWISMQARADRPLKKAWIRFQPANDFSRKTTIVDMAKMSLVGLTNPFGAAGSHVLSRQSWRKVPLAIDKSGKRISVKFRPWLKGTHTLHIEDKTGLYNEYEFNILLYSDPRPVVTLEQPAANRVVLPNAEITLKLTAADEKFGLKSAFLEYWRKDKEGRVLGKSERFPFYTPDMMAEGVTAGVTDADGDPMTLPAEGDILRPLFLKIDQRWSLDGLVQEGDILVLRGGANDFNEVSAFHEPGYSREVELTIVSKAVLKADLDAAQAKIQEKISRLKELQEAALKNIKDIEEELGEKGQLDPEEQKKLVNKLQDAQQWQKDMQKIIGKEKTEGLLKALEQLEQVIKDNKVESSDANDRVKLLKNEISKLEKEHLQLIGPELNKAKQTFNSIDPTKNSDSKKINETKNDLANAKEHQQKSLEKLEDLVNHLAKWAGLQRFRLEAQKLLKQQIKVRGETERLKDTLDSPDEDWKTQLAQNADQQQQLAADAKHLLDKLQQTSDKKKDSSPDIAKMLNEAAQIGLELDLHGEMNDAEEQIRAEQFHRAGKQQKIAITILEEMIETLTEERDDQLEKLIQKQLDAQSDIKDILEKLEKLQKKVEEANKIADPEEREKALKALADEHKKLTEQAEKKARELAMLRANKAGQALNEAAEKLDDARKKLDAGKDPQEQQKQALDELKKAQQKLEDAKKEAENELARERLAKIADEIKGLKERHESVQAQTEQFHKLILQGGWTDGIQGDYLNHSRVQDTLSEETSRLAQKLSGASVFELILRKAGHDMKNAAKRIEEHVIKNSQGRVGLFPLPDDVLEIEKKSYKQIAKFQKRAETRLQSLLDALKSAQKMMAKKPQEPADDQQPDGDPGGGGQKQGGIQAQDAIPPMAQLKALKSEQLNIYKRTQAFEKEHPNIQNLPPEAQAELDSIHADQEALFALFREIAGAANKGGLP